MSLFTVGINHEISRGKVDQVGKEWQNCGDVGTDKPNISFTSFYPFYIQDFRF